MKITKLDKLFSEFIRKRAIKRCGGCERCLTKKYDTQKEDGSTFEAYKNLQCSHFWGRRSKSVRYDPDNAAGICGGCHMYLSANPAEHERWFKKHIGERAYDLLEARKRMPCRNQDEHLIELYLKEEIRRLGL